MTWADRCSYCGYMKRYIGNGVFELACDCEDSELESELDKLIEAAERNPPKHPSSRPA